jgi:hypothetical protein
MPSEKTDDAAKAYFVKESDIENFHKAEMHVQAGQQQVRLSNVHYNRVMVFEFIQVFFATYGLLLSLILYESKGTSTYFEQNEGILLYYNAFCTFALVVSTYLKHTVYNDWYVARGIHSEFDNMFTTGQWKSLFFEIIFHMLSPYPHIQNWHYKEYID